MKSEFVVGMLLTLIVIFALDLYVFKGIRVVLEEWKSESWRRAIYILFWVISIGLAIGLVWSFGFYKSTTVRVDYTFFFYFFGVFLLFAVPKIIFICFHLIEDISMLVMKGSRSLISGDDGGELISRITFITKTGMALAAIPFVGLAYGMLKGRFDFKVRKEVLKFSHLPKAFDGLKIVQISDLHLGSFFNDHKSVQKGIDMINSLEPDILVFTGDLVNNYAYEAEGWESIFASLKAKVGKYSVLGNHDYGDYVAWPNEAAKRKNLEQVIEMNRKMGFQMLNNENAVLESNGEKIAFLGVENFGKPPFPQHGDLKKAIHGTDAIPFKVLLSHDPSHWDLEILGQTNIDLTLSGHTHGMQFGVEIGGIKWSPVKMKYPRWGGLYKEGNQFLYVNRGFGYIGYPGRVGMPPEITLIELKTA